MAGDGMAGFHWCKLRAHLLTETAIPFGVRAAWMEGAARRHIDQTGRRALDREQPLTPGPFEARYRTEQPPRVRVRGPVEQLVSATVLNRATRIHHQHIV